MKMTDLKDTIADNAAGPAEARGATISVRKHSLLDQIAADRYLAEKAAAANPLRGFFRAKIVPPGADGT